MSSALHRLSTTVSLTLSLAAAGCGGEHRTEAPSSKHADSSGGRRRWLVVAPHPDDETLIASGVLRRAAEEGTDAYVVVMTNGDLDCLHDGLGRQSESVAGLAELGIPEERVFFLGYPDGGLARLGKTPLPPLQRKIAGTCTKGNTTYGARGNGHADQHTVRFGAPAVYDRESAVADLAAVLERIEPTDVAITHPQDTHPDHAATYMLFRSALDRLSEAPRVHRALVHNGDCWPTGLEPGEPCAPTEIAPTKATPPLSGRLSGYLAREHIPVPASCLAANPRENPKLRAIAAHASQTRERPDSYLFAFARRDEAFFPESFERTSDRWRRASDSDVGPTTEVYLRLRSSELQSVRLSLPLALTFTLPPPSSDRVELEAMRDSTGNYTLAIDARAHEATLSRVFATGTPQIMARWPLPHDLWSASKDETFELTIEPRPDEGGIAELDLRVRGELAGVAMDVSPRTSGEGIALYDRGAPTERAVIVRGLSPLNGAPASRPAR